MQTNSVACETLQQECNNLLFGSLPTEMPCTDNTKFGCVTKSSAIAFYAICFSVLKPCSYWNSATSDAIVERASAFFLETVEYQAKSSQLPQNINIYGANINVNFHLRSEGTLLCNSPSSKLVLERLILQNATRCTGFLLHFPIVSLGCVFHKTSRSTTFFLISLNENSGLEIHKTNDANPLVQTVCEYVMNTLNCSKTEYCIQCVFCTCQLNKAEIQNILKCHKSFQQKIEIAMKRRKSNAQLEPAKKKVCLDRCHQYYKNEKQNILTTRAEKYKSMDSN